MIPTLIKNPNAIMQSITGDGVTTVIELQEYEVSCKLMMYYSKKRN